MPSKGKAEWNGDLKGGKGEFTAGESIHGAYSFKSRFEGEHIAGANPEELIGAAHAACYSMAFSNMLAEAGHTPDSIKTDASVTLKMVDDAPTITKIDLVVVGKVPGLDDAEFQKVAVQAKEGCPVSRALAGVGEITLDATLEG